MPKLVDKMLNFMGFEEEQEEDVEQEFAIAPEEERTTVQKPRRNNKGQVVSLHSQRQMRVAVIEPECFDDVQGITDDLKKRKTVFVNLEQADPKLAKRVVDFVSGATYALDGSMQKVGQGSFLFVPSNVAIDVDMKENDSEDRILSWMK